MEKYIENNFLELMRRYDELSEVGKTQRVNARNQFFKYLVDLKYKLHMERGSDKSIEFTMLVTLVSCLTENVKANLWGIVDDIMNGTRLGMKVGFSRGKDHE